MNRQLMSSRILQRTAPVPSGLQSISRGVQKAQRQLLKCNAGKTIQIPIFPLNLVALPHATVPLVVFEARYRVLFNTLLAGSEGVEEGLVAPDSPYKGTKKFGMCFIDDQSRLAAIGTMLEIVEHAHIEDGRIFTTNKGRERFKITRVVKEKPILVCEVEVLEESEEDITSPEVVALGQEVAGLLRTVIQLNVKMDKKEAGDDQMEPEELAELGPRELSFWVASFFSDVKKLQQNLLEEDSTAMRLNTEKTILKETVKYYQAKSALQSAFDTSDATEVADLLQVPAAAAAVAFDDASNDSPPDSVVADIAEISSSVEQQLQQQVIDDNDTKTNGVDAPGDESDGADGKVQ